MPISFQLSGGARRFPRRRVPTVCVLAFLGVTLAACDFLDNLLAVKPLDRVVSSDVERPERASLLANSVITELECAISRYVVDNGLLSGELQEGSVSPWTAIERREVGTGEAGQMWITFPCSNLIQWGFYTPLATARWLGDHVLSLLEGWTDAEVPNRAALIATVAAYTGYAKILLGESMCTVALDERGEVMRAQTFELAETDFTRAIQAAQVAGSNDILNMAYVGRARARLNLGRKSDAAADARLVPTGFVKLASNGPGGRRENMIYGLTEARGYVTVAERFQNVMYQGVADPRVQVVNTGRTTVDGQTELWVPAQHRAGDAPIPLATWEEAQLIIAEAELDAGDVESPVAIINVLHERVGLPPFESADPAEILDQIFYERSAELFLSSHRLGDINRYGIPLVPAPGTPHPKGGVYQAATCWGLPLQEIQNNPYISR